MYFLIVMLFTAPAVFSQAIPAEVEDSSINWSDLYTTFASTLVAVPAIAEIIKRIAGSFVKTGNLVNQIISWGAGLLVVAAGWLFDLGWLKDLNVWQMLVYGTVACLASNGVFDFINNLIKNK
jgi:hypothetical protein